MIIWARRYRIHSALCLASLEVLIWRWVDQPVAIPGRRADVAWVLSPVVTALLGSCVPSIARTTYAASEIVSGRPVWRRRVAVVVVLGCLTTVAPAAGLGLTAEAAVGLRNGILLLGLGLWSALLLPVGVTWLPTVVLPIVMWLIGSPDAGAAPPPWALMLHAADAGGALGTTLAVGLTGGMAYVARTLPIARSDD